MDENERLISDQIAWLETASPDDWHRVVLDFNWDWDIEPLFWIARQPQCDKATALTMFWLGQPAYHLIVAKEKGGVDDNEDPTWQMLKYIARRINAKGYTRSKIAYKVDDGTLQDFEELTETAKELSNPPLTPHPDMRRSLGGARIVNDVPFYQRYPEELHGTVLVDLPDDVGEGGPLDKVWSAMSRLWRN